MGLSFLIAAQRGCFESPRRCSSDYVDRNFRAMGVNSRSLVPAASHAVLLLLLPKVEVSSSGDSKS